MAQATPQKKHYPGDEYFPKGDYDYIFDVDVSDDGPKIKLPYNEGDNALVVAEKFLLREGMGLGHKNQIVEFITKNTRGKANMSAGAAQQKPAAPPKPKTCFPLRQSIFYEDMNLDGLFAKIQEFNTKLQTSADASAQALTEYEIKYVQSVVSKLRDPALYTYVKEFSGFEIDVLKKLVRWPAEFAVPVMDLWRCVVVHHASQVFFSGVDSGLPIIAALVGKIKTGAPVLWSIFFKLISNFFIHTNNALGIVRGKDIIGEAYKLMNKKDPKVVALCANYLMNCSSSVDEFPACNDEFVQEQIRMIGELVQQGDLTQEAQLKLAIALGNFAALKPSAASEAPAIMRLFVPRLEPLQDDYSKQILSSFKAATGL